MSESIEDALERAAAAIEARIANCHQEVECPRCGVPVGVKCHRLGQRGDWRAPLKHPHRERWAKVVPYR